MQPVRRGSQWSGLLDHWEAQRVAELPDWLLPSEDDPPDHWETQRAVELPDWLLAGDADPADERLVGGWLAGAQTMFPRPWLGEN